MSKLRIFIAIVVFILLILIGIFLPWIWNTHASNPKKDSGTPTKSEETEADTAYTFHEFEGLSAFLSKSLISDLKECFPVYLSRIEKPSITDITFLPEETQYPDTYTTQLFFLLSDDTRLPVRYRADLGVFLFGEEETEFATKQQIYEQETDDSLPAVTPEEVENQQEGGLNDTGSKEVQP